MVFFAPALALGATIHVVLFIGFKSGKVQITAEHVFPKEQLGGGIGGYQASNHRGFSISR